MIWYPVVYTSLTRSTSVRVRAEFLLGRCWLNVAQCVVQVLLVVVAVAFGQPVDGTTSGRVSEGGQMWATRPPGHDLGRATGGDAPHLGSRSCGRLVMADRGYPDPGKTCPGTAIEREQNSQATHTGLHVDTVIPPARMRMGSPRPRQHCSTPTPYARRCDSPAIMCALAVPLAPLHVDADPYVREGSTWSSRFFRVGVIINNKKIVICIPQWAGLVIGCE